METLDASQVLDVRAPMADLGYGEEGLQTLLSGEVVLMPADQPIRPEDIKPGDWVMVDDGWHSILVVKSRTKREILTNEGLFWIDRVLEVRRG